MRYRIDRKDFFAREEEQGTMAIMVLRTNQILHFNRAGRHIFDICDQWVALDDFLHRLGAVNTTPAKLRRYYEELLYKLHACGLAKLEDVPAPTGTGCRLASLGDYDRVSRFLLKNADRGCSCAAMLSPAYNSRYGVYTRIYERQKQYLLSERDGELLALLEVHPAAHIAGSAALTIMTVVFHASLDATAAKEQLSLLTDHAASVFSGSMSKLRYAAMSPRQDWIATALQGCGFVQTAHFPGELQNGSDLRWLDRMI